MSRKPLSPEALKALHEVMRKACERMETNKSRRQSELDADELARAMVRLCDEMGPNV
jgi:hypothetical protein